MKVAFLQNFVQYSPNRDAILMALSINIDSTKLELWA